MDFIEFTSGFTKELDKCAKPGIIHDFCCTYLLYDKLVHDSDTKSYIIRAIGCTRGVVKVDKFGIVTKIEIDENILPTNIRLYNKNKLQECISNIIGKLLFPEGDIFTPRCFSSIEQIKKITTFEKLRGIANDNF